MWRDPSAGLRECAVLVALGCLNLETAIPYDSRSVPSAGLLAGLFLYLIPARYRPIPDQEDRDWQRLDKWLWCARFMRQRSDCARLVAQGSIRINRLPTEKDARSVA